MDRTELGIMLNKLKKRMDGPRWLGREVPISVGRVGGERLPVARGVRYGQNVVRELAPDMDAAIARMLELYKAYCREMIWLNPDWIAPLKDCDYLCDCWFSGGPARVLCEVINENKPG